MNTRTRKKTNRSPRKQAIKATPINEEHEMIDTGIDEMQVAEEETASQPQETVAETSAPAPAPRHRQQNRWRDPERARLRRTAATDDVLIAPLWAQEMAKELNLTLRFVNDRGSTGQRIQNMKERGWDLVQAPQGAEREPGWTSAGETGADSSLVSRVVDSQTGMRAYLMAIPNEWYTEDQRRKQEKIDRAEAPLFRGAGMRNSYGETTTEVKT